MDDGQFSSLLGSSLQMDIISDNYLQFCTQTHTIICTRTGIKQPSASSPPMLITDLRNRALAAPAHPNSCNTPHTLPTCVKGYPTCSLARRMTRGRGTSFLGRDLRGHRREWREHPRRCIFVVIPLRSRRFGCAICCAWPALLPLRLLIRRAHRRAPARQGVQDRIPY